MGREPRALVGRADGGGDDGAEGEELVDVLGRILPVHESDRLAQHRLADGVVDGDEVCGGPGHQWARTRGLRAGAVGAVTAGTDTATPRGPQRPEAGRFSGPPTTQADRAPRVNRLH